MLRTTAAALTLCLAASQSMADKAAGDACAAALTGEPKIIYADASPAVTTLSALRAMVTDRVKALVAAGKVKKDTAVASAQAAGQCLRKIP